MNKMKKLINNPVSFTFLLNVLVLLVSVLVFHPQFEENDDAFLAMIAEGAYGARDFHLIYSNVCLGKILNAFYAVLPAVRWHSVFQYIFLFMAFSMVTYLLCRRSHGKMLSLLFLLCTFYESYVLLQYTKTAVIISVTGYILLFETVRRKRQTGKFPAAIFIMGDILLLYGALLRSSAFLLASVPMLCVGLYELYMILSEEGKQDFVKKLLSYVKVFAPVLCAVLLLFVVDNRAYAGNAEWKAFMEYNDTRMDLLDYRYDLLDYSAHQEQLKSLGISENDALLYLTWQFADDRILDVDSMQNILAGAAPRSFDLTMLKAFVSHLFEELYSLSALIPGLICMLVLLFFYMQEKEKKRQKGFLLFVCSNLCIAAVILIYYQYSGRWNHRVVYGLFMALLAAFIYEGVPKDSKDGAEKSAVTGIQFLMTAILLFFNLGLLLQNQFDYQDYFRTTPDYRAQTACMQMDKDKLFVTDTFTFQQAYRYEVFHAYACGELDNVVSVGSWFINSPITKAVTEKYGYTNPFEALEQGTGNVMLIDNCYPGEKALYLSEHTQKTYEAEFLETRNGLDSYIMKEKAE